MTDILDLVQGICSSETLASFVYQVRQSSLFRLLLGFMSQKHKNHVSEVIEKVGEIFNFYHSAVTIVRAAANFCDDESYLNVVTLVSPQPPIDALP